MATGLADAMEKATGWLISIQDKSGGWGEYQGATPNVLNTAEAILALVDSNQCSAGNDRIQKAVDYLKSCQLGAKSLAASRR